MKSAILAAINSHPFGRLASDIAEELHCSVQDLGPEIEELKNSQEILGFGGLWITSDQLEALAGKIKKQLKERGAVAHTLIFEELHCYWLSKVQDRLVAFLALRGDIAVAGPDIASLGAMHKLNLGQETLLAKITSLLEAHDLEPPSPKDLAKKLGVPVQAVTGILNLGKEQGFLVEIDPGMWMTRTKLFDIFERATKYFGLREFSAGEFRTEFKTSRKFAIPLLEFADQVGWTQRKGDERVFRNRE